jgi:CheY-like chemotaxis protein
MVKAWTKVLIVDDDANSIELTVQAVQLHSPQASIAAAHDGAQCLQMLDQVMPELVVMDLHMPGVDGWQALASIRQNTTWQGLPVVAITAYDSPNVAHDALNAGFNAYFPKPIDLRVFTAYLTNLGA